MMSSLWWATIGCWPGISFSASAEGATGVPTSREPPSGVGYSSPSPNMWPNSWATVVWSASNLPTVMSTRRHSGVGAAPVAPTATSVGCFCAPAVTISLLTPRARSSESVWLYSGLPSELEWPVTVTGNGGMSAAPSVAPNFCSLVLSAADGSRWFFSNRMVPGLSVSTWLYLARVRVLRTKWLESGFSIPSAALSWKRAVDWSAVAPGGVTDSSSPGSVGHLLTVVTKCDLPAPVSGRSTISMFTLTAGSLSAQHAFWVKNTYLCCQVSLTFASALAFQAVCSSGVQLNCSALYVAAFAGPPTEATQVGSDGLPLTNLNVIPTVIVRLPSPGA